MRVCHFWIGICGHCTPTFYKPTKFDSFTRNMRKPVQGVYEHRKGILGLLTSWCFKAGFKANGFWTCSTKFIHEKENEFHLVSRVIPIRRLATFEIEALIDTPALNVEPLVNLSSLHRRFICTEQFYRLFFDFKLRTSLPLPASSETPYKGRRQRRTQRVNIIYINPVMNSDFSRMPTNKRLHVILAQSPQPIKDCILPNIRICTEMHNPISLP